jgi:GAF domain-containing protein
LIEMIGRISAHDVSFLSMHSAVFCVQCELISENNTPHCLACGSQAVLSLSRVLGGSLRGQATARLIADAELDRLVRELLRAVPQPAEVSHEDNVRAGGNVHEFGRHHVRTRPGSGQGGENVEARGVASDFEIHSAEVLEPGISIMAERAQALTGATGAAIALRQGSEIVCRARAGRTAPDLGVRLQTNSGLSAECVRRGEVLVCHDAEDNPQVDLASCRRLGVRSILVAPLKHFRKTLGVFEVLSAAPHAFDQRDAATMQLLSSLMVAAISRLSALKPAV